MRNTASLSHGSSVQDVDTAKFKATVAGGEIVWRGRCISLPFIRGSGTFRVRYLGRRVRIFENPGALAVQVPERILD